MTVCFVAPCPFCGGVAKDPFMWNGTLETGCADLQCAGSDVCSPVRLWNRRAGRIAMHRRAQRAEGDLTKLLAQHREVRKRWLYWLKRASAAERSSRELEARAADLLLRQVSPIDRIIALGERFA